MILELLFLFCLGSNQSREPQKRERIIEILPYNPENLPAAAQGATSIVEHGENKLFKAISVKTNSEEMVLLKQLVDYTDQCLSGKDGPNTLLVELRLKQKSQTVCNVYCGVFVSGENTYISQSVGDRRVHKAILEKVSLDKKKVMPALNQHMKVEDQEYADLTDAGEKFADQTAQKLLTPRTCGQYVYRVKLFTLDSRSLPLISLNHFYSEMPKSEEIGNQLLAIKETSDGRDFLLEAEGKKRPREEGEDDFKDMIARTLLAYSRLGIRLVDRFFIDIKDKIFPSKEPQRMQVIAQHLFGCDMPDPGRNVSGTFPRAFYDSEQVWLLFMEKYDQVKDNFPVLIKDQQSDQGATAAVPAGSVLNIDEIEVRLFSYRDICKYCRGTISSLLSRRGESGPLLSSYLWNFVPKLKDVHGQSFNLAQNFQVSVQGYSYLENVADKK